MKKKGGGAVTVFKKQHKDVTNNISTLITSYIPNGLKSFSMELKSHWSYNGDGDGYEALGRLDRMLQKRVQAYLNESIWDFIILDLVYPETVFKSGSSFVVIQLTAGRRTQSTDYDSVAKPLLDLRDHVVGLIGDEFSFSRKKVVNKESFSF
jgi:hypothetical protein